MFLIRSLGSGGAERQLVTLMRELARRGEEVSVAVFYPGGALEASLLHSGVVVYSLDKRGRMDLIRFFMRLVGLLRRTKPEVLHGYLPTGNIAALAMRPFLPGVRVIWGIRVSEMMFVHYGFFARITYAVERLLARFPDRIIFNSFAGRERYEARGFPTSKMVVVPNGIDTDYFKVERQNRCALRQSWGVGDYEILVGIAARLDPMKDHETFLRAASIAARSRPDLRFVCVGGGSETEQARLNRSAEEIGVASRVVWAGEIQEMPAAYSAFDIAVCSSLGEGFPNMVGEAMACEVPCVVTDVGDCARIVGETGLVVPRRDSEALARSIVHLAELGPSERRALGKRARERILVRCSVCVLANNTLDALAFGQSRLSRPLKQFRR